MPNITPEQIESLLSELQTGLTDLAKSEAAKAIKDPELLAKAHPGEETKDEGTPDTSATSNGPKDDSKPAAPEPDHSAVKADEGSAPAPVDGAPAPDMSGAPADPAATDDGPVDPVKLHEEYSKLSPEDLKAHYIACKAALFELVGTEGSDDGTGGEPDGDEMSPAAPGAAPVAAPPAAPPVAASPAPDAPPTMKGEKDMSGGANGGPMKTMSKSEQDIKIETLEKELATTHEALGKLTKAMETVMTTPIRKSVTSIADLSKEAPKASINLSREEVRGKLRDKIREGKLSKSDQELVIKFDLGSIKVQDVAHILESKTS